MEPWVESKPPLKYGRLWVTAAPSWIWVITDIPILQEEMGVMTHVQSSPDLSCSSIHCSGPAAALQPGRKTGQFGSWMKHHRT